jgi:RNA polymerase sigma factor (sigma-70 family)
MQASGMNGLVRHLHRIARTQVSDRELVAALMARRDEAAFAALVERHGPMVLAVCQRVLHNAHDAEDAFQSTFLVLIRKASAIRKPDAIASWLYGVAYLTARKARQANARQRALEFAAACQPRVGHTEPSGVLDEEISALPERYRAPLVLCELEGRSRREVASQLRIPEGTLSSRLAKGRQMLARRMRRHGWTLSGAVPVGTKLPTSIAMSTVAAARSILLGREMAGAVSPGAIALSRGVMRAMFISRLKTLTAVLVVLTVFGLGTGQLARVVLGPGIAAAADDAPAATTPAVERAAAELAAAETARRQAEIALEVARARAARKETEFRRLQATLPGVKAELGARMQTIASRFKYRIPVEIGRSQTTEDGRIQILDVWGTRPEIAVGGNYLVHGTYSMPSSERGKLYFHLSASDPRMAVSYDVDLQCVSVQKGEGEFTLMHSMMGPGFLHLQLLGHDGAQSPMLADVYFGTGNNVLRDK